MRHMNLILAHKKVHRKHVPRTVVVAGPDIMWETDITKVYTDNEWWIYFTAYVDLCSGKIKGRPVSRVSRTREMVEAFDNAILNTFPDPNVSGLIIRSDDGSQFTSHRYEKHLRTLGIMHETLHEHTLEENGHIESYFWRFKEDYIYTRDFINYDEFQKYVGLAANDYNTIRPYLSLNYLTPKEFETAIMNEEFRKGWIGKQMKVKKHVEFLE